MNSRNLEALLWTVRLGGVGAAARHLNLTQPAVTRRLQELEKELGAPLFRREGRKVIPTNVGEGCLASAEKILAEVSAIRMVASGRIASGRVRTGVAEFVALTWFPDFLDRIEERFPDVQLDIDVDLSSRLITRLKQRKLEIVLVPGTVSVAGAVRVDLGPCQFSWMAHPRFLRRNTEFGPAELAELPIITLPPEANVHDMTMDWFAAAGIQPRRIHYCTSFSVVAALVRRGVGISLLQADAFANDLETGQMVILGQKLLMPKIQYTAVYLPPDPLSIVPEIASFAQKESWFLRPKETRWRSLSF